MASSNISNLTDMQRSDKYQRTLSLNFDCGSDTLRKLIDTELDSKGITFKKHVKDPGIQNKIKQLKQKKVMFSEQVKILNSKDPDCMDVSLLTIILLELFPVSATRTKSLKMLRQKRNELAHRAKSMLEDDVPFNEASQLITSLAKEVSSEFEKEMGRRIEELKKRELVRTRSSLEVIQLNNEYLMVKLVETGKNETVDGNNEIWIKLGLTKYVRQLARSLDVDVLLQELKAQGVIKDPVKRSIEQVYNYEEQMQQLVLHLMNETTENLLKFCSCLKKQNSLLADLVQHQTFDERDIALKLQAAEKVRIQEVIKSSLVPKEKSSIACEDVHIFVEDKQKCAVRFPLVQECIKECFPCVNFEENDSRFHGITWMDGIDIDIFSEEKLTDGTEEILTDMACDKFGAYLTSRIEKVKEGIGCYFEETASEECISAEIFAKLTDEQMEQLFSDRLNKAGVKFAFGIRSALLEIQKTIKRQINRTSSERKATLRKFDTPAEHITYTKSTVSPSTGNLLTPAHVFVCPVLKRQCNTAFMAKEVIRFALACINGKKNGTIHLGIKEAGNGNGEIVGLSKDRLSDVRMLDDEISSCIKNCFVQKHHSLVERCIRPAQVIPVEEDFVVLEVDIVPFSGYIKDECIHVNYPPKGFQRWKCFLLRENTIYTIEKTKLDSIYADFKELFRERVHLEMKEIQTPDRAVNTEVNKKLTKLLTGGNKYVTDSFIPILCSGDMSGCAEKEEIRVNISSMAVAFTSAAAVFDFDSSVDLRNDVEKGNTYFQIKIAEDFSTKRYRRVSDITGESNIWLYSNGNEELGKDKMTSELWYANRLGGVKNAFQQIRQQIPLRRGLVIFLVFQKPIECDPMLEIAREAFLTTFKDECIVLAETDVVLQEWRNEMKGKISKEEFDNKIVSGISWEEVAAIIKSVFEPSKDVLFKFPCSSGHAVEMTRKEMDELQLSDIELVDGYAEEHCRLQEEFDTDENCRMKRSEEQEKFYRGNAVTWWNFYYTTQVGKRDAYECHKDNIEKKLSSRNSKFRYEIHHIEHNPGAGGSTVGRNLLWHFSQIGRKPEKAYRSCIVHKITENTADEIYRFKDFKEKCMADAKPVIVLVDNKSEEHLNMLKYKLDEMAYKKGSPDKLFCLLLIVSRVPVSHVSRDVIIQHNLSKKEKMWFQKKFEELKSNTYLKVNTLIAFNVMRHSFDGRYIEETTQELVNEINNKEIQLLGYLSVICSFDSDNPVPETVFDSVMMEKVCDHDTLTLEQCMNKPFGIVMSEKERRNLQKVEREAWNVSLTGAMQLLITHRSLNSDSRPFNGVCILSQPLARAVLKLIMQVRKKTFQSMVTEMLELVEQHQKETNAMSKHFIKIVCSLFTSRESYTDEKGEIKVQKFSPLVLRLEEQLENDTVLNAQSRVIDVINRCFKITGSAMVGQQLARYYYLNTKDYSAAEDTIKSCLLQLPHNSYLLDTYGQIYKTHMEQIFASFNRSDSKMVNIDAAECIGLAFKAVEKFRLAQEASTFHEDNSSFNSNSFYMEVMTVLCLLENFHKFECFGDRTTFWEFLNKEDMCLEKSAYKDIIVLAPELETFRKGHETQHHMENSLRTLEERAYMTRNLVTVFTPSGDELLLKPREKFEMFYGSKEHTLQCEFLYGVGLKLLMKADKTKDSHLKLVRRVKEAESRLQNKDSTEIERDLLVYLGYNILKMSSQDIVSSQCLYRQLLNYSTNLWTIQRHKGKRDRRYVEAYLYYALLHWISPDRTTSEIENLSHPETYKVLIKEWEEVYMENNNIKSKEQLSKVKPKIYFALGNSRPGNDIVDLEWLRHSWREAMLQQGRARWEVKADNHWHHPIFEEHLARLFGTVDCSGKWVSTEVTYNQREYTLKIRTLENFAPLSNRAVTFVLAFSWMSLVALDVRKFEKTFRRQTSQRSPENTQENLYQTAEKRDAILVPDVKKHKTWQSNAEELQQKPVSRKDERKLPEKEPPSYVENNVSSARANSTTDAKGKGRGIGRGRGAGRGRGRGIDMNGSSRKTQNVPRVGNPSKSGNSLAMKASTVVPKKQSGTRAEAAEGSVSVASRCEVASSGLEKSLDSTQAQSSEFSSTAKENDSSCEFIEQEDSADEWHTVTAKKKPNVAKKEQQKKDNQVPTALAAKSCPKQNFEDLIRRCKEKFPLATRSELVNAYNSFKQRNDGSLKGLSMEYIQEEIGKQLGFK